MLPALSSTPAPSMVSLIFIRSSAGMLPTCVRNTRVCALHARHRHARVVKLDVCAAGGTTRQTQKHTRSVTPVKLSRAPFTRSSVDGHDGHWQTSWSGCFCAAKAAYLWAWYFCHFSENRVESLYALHAQICMFCCASNAATVDTILRLSLGTKGDVRRREFCHSETARGTVRSRGRLHAGRRANPRTPSSTSKLARRSYILLVALSLCNETPSSSPGVETAKEFVL